MPPVDDKNDSGSGEVFSPPCSLHEADPAYAGLERDPQAVSRWRKGVRERLIAARLAMAADERLALGEKIAAHLERALGDVRGLTVSAYWPFRGEPDFRPLMARIVGHGGQTALPVVVTRAAPMIFRCWRAGDPLEKGIWNIPVPAETAETVIPDIVIAPLVGFDGGKYRLGYGGGYFDRTLASLKKKPRVIGAGYAMTAIPTIYPQEYDIPMDEIVTEAGSSAYSVF